MYANIADSKVEFTEEEQQRYDDIKEKTLRLYPSLNNIQLEMSEHLFRYYAKKGVIPDSPDSVE